MKKIATILLLATMFKSFGQTTQLLSIEETKQALERSIKIHERATLLCNLALLYVQKPGAVANDLDSALLLITQATAFNAVSNDQALKARIYYVNSTLFREKGMMREGKNFIEQAIALYKKLPASYSTGEAYREAVNYYSNDDENELPQVTGYLDSATAIFHRIGDKASEAATLQYLGDVQQIYGHYGEAIINLHTALDIFNSINYKSVQGIYDLLGMISNTIGDHDNAVKYGLLAVKTAEAVHDTSMQLCTIYNRLSLSYIVWDKQAEATSYARDAMDIAVKYNDKEAIIVILPSLVYLYIQNKKWQQAADLVKKIQNTIQLETLQDSIFLYSSLTNVCRTGHKDAEAKKYADKLIGIIQTHGPEDASLGTAYRALIVYLLETKQFILAKKYAADNVLYCLRGNRTTLLSRAYYQEAKADSALGNYKEALDHYEAFKNLNDSMFSESKSFQFNQMQVIYETEKKDKDIKLQQKNIELLTNKSAYQELNLEKINASRNLIIFSAIILLTLLYTGYRFKQRHNIKLQSQQTEINEQNNRLKELLAIQHNLVEEKEWLVKEIHHRVKNNLQMIISLLNAQTEFLDNPSALHAIRESRERMQAIALIHQKLYRTEDNASINMISYIREMIAYMESSVVDTSRIKFELDADDIDLDVSQAVPVGLILNEAITNSVKYAFPENKPGTIGISLKQKEDHHLLVTISDNGKGFSGDVNPETNNSLGIQLIKLFAEQLEGDLRFESVTGVKILLTFKQININHTTGAFLQPQLTDGENSNS